MADSAAAAKIGIAIIVLRQKSGNRGTDQKPESKSNTDDSERLGAFLRTRDIRDVCLRQREVSGRRAVDGAGQKQDRQRRRKRRHDKPDERPQLAHDQQRLAPHVIRHASQEGPGD